ncbi:hypothetical protein A2U01_0079221, partial [Trifolium medium]|nr:hypothetical protein [Trifolium medium]
MHISTILQTGFGLAFLHAYLERDSFGAPCTS